ncbi:MAG: GNAT family N-acetyltransferase [Candidatus Heimdallarchaeota archaeon]
MTTSEIHLCNRKELPLFTQIMCQAFNDKYPFFFKGLSEKDYIELVTTLNILSYDRFGNQSKYLLYHNGVVVGALEVYTAPRKELPFGMVLKVLKKKYRLLPAIKTALMLFGFGPPKIFPANTLYIDKIGIREGFRRRGFGKKLLNYAFQLAREQNLSNVELEVITTNTGAIALYKKIGFQIVGTTKTPLGRIFVGVEKYHHMHKLLGD